MSASSSIEDEIKESLLYDENPRSSELYQENRRLRRCLMFVSIITTAFFCTSALLAFRHPTASDCQNVFPTEFGTCSYLANYTFAY